eukprot:Tbor_TRINITY_DN5983_c1_g7::TRINITY_DN5983_c1_g7_i1::g.18668::m.18668
MVFIHIIGDNWIKESKKVLSIDPCQPIKRYLAEMQRKLDINIKKYTIWHTKEGGRIGDFERDPILTEKTWGFYGIGHKSSIYIRESNEDDRKPDPDPKPVESQADEKEKQQPEASVGDGSTAVLQTTTVATHEATSDVIKEISVTPAVPPPAAIPTSIDIFPPTSTPPTTVVSTFSDAQMKQIEPKVSPQNAPVLEAQTQNGNELQRPQEGAQQHFVKPDYSLKTQRALVPHETAMETYSRDEQIMLLQRENHRLRQQVRIAIDLKHINPISAIPDEDRDEAMNHLISLEQTILRRRQATSAIVSLYEMVHLRRSGGQL